MASMGHEANGKQKQTDGPTPEVVPRHDRRCTPPLRVPPSAGRNSRVFPPAGASEVLLRASDDPMQTEGAPPDLKAAVQTPAVLTPD